jgi:hypothetical protein
LCTSKLKAKSYLKDNDLSYRQKELGYRSGIGFSGSIVTNLFVHTEFLSAIADPTKSRFPMEHRLLEGSLRGLSGAKTISGAGRIACSCVRANRAALLILSASRRSAP